MEEPKAKYFGEISAPGDLLLCLWFLGVSCKVRVDGAGAGRPVSVYKFRQCDLIPSSDF